MPPSPTRVESINGLRGLCILLVLVGHVHGTAGMPTAIDDAIGGIYGVMKASRYAVHAFFVLSGYFITKMLVAEQQRAGTISLWRFYLRRALRFFPGLAVLLVVMGTLAMAGWATLHRSDVLHAVTFTMNYDDKRGWALGHLWSLSVQEQFYLFWPLLLVLARPRGAMKAALAIVIVAPLLRAAILLNLAPAGPGWMGETFQTVADAMAVGGLLAGVQAGLWTHPIVEWLRRRQWSWLALLALAVAFHHWYRPGEVLGKPLVNVSMALLIDGLAVGTMPRVSRVLSYAPLPQIGVMSYSVYLWQQLFLDRYSNAPIAHAPLNLILAMMVGTIAYHLIEKPVTEARPRIEGWLAARLPARRLAAVE